jgi:heptosyltransferase-3
LSAHDENFPFTEPQNILIFRLGNLGDNVVALPAFHAIRNAFPESHISLLCPEMGKLGFVPASEVVKMTGLCDDILLYSLRSQNDGDSLSTPSLIFKLRIRKFECLFYLPTPQRTTLQIWRDHIFFKLCGIPAIVGPRKASNCYPRDGTGRLKPVLREGDRLCTILSNAGIPVSRELGPESRALIPVDPEVVTQMDNYLQINGLKSDHILIAICPGSKMPAKMWPLERFIEVGKQLLSRFNVMPIVLGSPSERGLGQQLVETWRVGINGAGTFTLRQAAECLRRCALYIGNDTGTMHLAAAVSTPCLAIFSGRDSPGRWEPSGDGHIVLRTWTECEGCMRKECPVSGHPCLSNTSVGKVVESASRILADR